MTVLVAFICFVLLVSPVVAYSHGRRKHQLGRERVLARRLGEFADAPARAACVDTRPGTRMALLPARLGTLPWVGGYLSETMRQATVPMLLAIPALLVAGTIVSVTG